MRKFLGVLLIAIFGVLFFGSNRVEAAYLDKRIQVGPRLYLVGTIYADDNGSGYVNGKDEDIYAHGVSGLKIEEKK